MTDYRSAIAGNYPGGLKQTCILNEGAPTVQTATHYDQLGKSMTVLTWAAELVEGDVVAIDQDTGNTFAAADGIPVVNTPVNTDTFVIGRIVSTPKIKNTPANTAAGNSWAKQLAGGYYRKAVVEIWGGITKIIKAQVTTIETHTIVPGVITKLNYDISQSTADHDLCFICAASDGVGAIPFHYVEDAVAGHEYSCLVGITGLMYAVT